MLKETELWKEPTNFWALFLNGVNQERISGSVRVACQKSGIVVITKEKRDVPINSVKEY